MKTQKKQYRLLSRTGLLATFVLAATMIGCEQFDLQENPAASQLAVVPYSTTEQLELGVSGIYGQLNKAAWMTTFYVNGWSGDDMTTHRASNKADFREYDQRFITAINSRSSDNWAAVFSMVRAANTVLASAEGQELPDPEATDRLLGETYFLRGIMFYHLVRVHGRIPLPLDVDPDARPELATTVEVYNQIESDLTLAESLLPTTSNLGASRPNKGSARSMLSRLYLDWAGFPVKDDSKYAQAAASAKQVMDGGHGFALVPDVATLWTNAGRFNTESLFTIAYCNSCNLPNRKMGKLGLPGDYAGWQETFAEIRFFEDFPEGARKDATYHTEVPVDVEGGATAAVSGADRFVPWTEFKDQQNPIFRKIVGPFEDAVFLEFQTDRNDYFMRYAELLLIFAEASGEAGTDGPDAWEALNMVRRRAQGLPVDTPDPTVDLGPGDGNIVDLAYEERKWELAGEYLRWNDLLRKEQVETALGGTARDPRVSIGTAFDDDGNGSPLPLTGPSNPILGSLGTDNYFAPIPQEEIDRNPNLAN